MSLTDLLDRLEFRTDTSLWNGDGTIPTVTHSNVSASTKQFIEGAIVRLYQSGTLAGIFETFLNQHDSTIKFSEYTSLRFKGAFAYGTADVGGWIGINPSESGDMWWFNDKGTLVNPNADIVIAHELLHYLASYEDSNNSNTPTDAQISSVNFDFKGQNTTTLNIASREIGLADYVRSSYTLYDRLTRPAAF